MRISKKPEERRQEIIDTAMELFKNQGYEKTSVEDITNAMNVAKGSFYNYFKSKREVFEVCITSKTQLIISAYIKILTCEEKTASQRLKDYIEYNFKLSENSHEIGLFDSFHSPDFELFHHQAQTNGINAILPMFVHLIEDGKKDSGFRTKDSEFTASALLGALREVHNLLAARKVGTPDSQRRLVYGLIKQILGVDII